ncbi:MAG: hypothetical protein P8J37_19290 [Fuerstiella sp.]|nr:hypothetical protein [Fuerstiella sp.]
MTWQTGIFHGSALNTVDVAAQGARLVPKASGVMLINGREGNMLPRRLEFAALMAAIVFCNCASAQNFERYRPQTLPPGPITRPHLQAAPAPVQGSDRVLLDALDAVIVVDDVSRVEPQEANADAVGLVRRFGDHSSLVHSAAFASVVQQHLNQPVSLRSLNQLSRDIINFYRHNKQPVVDVVTGTENHRRDGADRRH